MVNSSLKHQGTWCCLITEPKLYFIAFSSHVLLWTFIRGSGGFCLQCDFSVPHITSNPCCHNWHGHTQHSCLSMWHGQREKLCFKKNKRLYILVYFSDQMNKALLSFCVVLSIPAAQTSVISSVFMSLLTKETLWSCLLAEPDWASYTLGIFVCLNCSGMHRNLPTISKVKSIRLDRWEDSLVEV